MRGRILFRHGPHASRIGYRALPTAKGEAEFRRNFPQLLAEIEKIADPFPVHEDAVRALNIAILVARAEARRSTPGNGPGAAKDTTSRVTRDDRISQLVALEKIGDDAALLDALRSIDDKTLAAIDAENLALIAEEINKHGKFIDAHGNELHFPVSLRIPVFVPQDRPRATIPRGFDGLREELAARGCDMSDPAAVLAGIEALFQSTTSSALRIEQQHASATPAYLPMGVLGLRQSIRNALGRVQAEPGTPGNRAKTYQHDLAQACWDFWNLTVPSSFRGKAWQTGQGAKSSKMLEFSSLVFAAAGFCLSSVTLAEVLNKKRGN